MLLFMFQLVDVTRLELWETIVMQIVDNVNANVTWLDNFVIAVRYAVILCLEPGSVNISDCVP